MSKFCIFIFILPLMLSCSSEDYNDLDVTQPYEDSILKSTSAWICHHPGTNQHNSSCIEKEYPDGCYVSGDNSKFCWLLEYSDCLNPLMYEWQFSHCPLLKEE